MLKKETEALRKSYINLAPFSEKYETDFERFNISLQMLESRGLIKNKKILDIGCGIGIMALTFKELGGEATGMDKFIFPEENSNFFSISDFEKLKKIWTNRGLNIINHDISEEKLPFKNESFDVVICDATIEHLAFSPKNLFLEINRILKINGIFLVSTPNVASLLKRIRFVFGRSPNWDICDFFESGKNFKGHLREFTEKEVKKMIERSGFEIMEAKTRNVFFNQKRLFSPKKTINQIGIILSYFLPNARDMIYVLAAKK